MSILGEVLLQVLLVILLAVVSAVAFAVVFILLMNTSLTRLKTRRFEKGGGKPGLWARLGLAELPPPEPPPVLLSDVLGIDEVKQEVEELVAFLKDPAAFTAIGSRVPKGILFVGSPGVGKTLLARAIANEAGVPFYSASGAEFAEVFVGMGAGRVRSLYKQAREHPAAIVFIDEIDALGMSRFKPQMNHDHQTLNQLLAELDGFTSHHVITIGATNATEGLDPALLRPGRFDRTVHVPLPRLEGRTDILRHYLGRTRHEASVDAIAIARATIGMSGADLANLVNEAGILAVREGRELIGQRDLGKAIERVTLGLERRQEHNPGLRETAYHEAGHALVAHHLQPHKRLHKVSIVPTGPALGYAWSVETEERLSSTREELLSEIQVLLGGYVAEQLVFGTTTAGVVSDLDQVGRIASRMVTAFGMGGFLFNTGAAVSEETARAVDARMREITESCRDRVRDLLSERRDQLDALAARLLEREVLDADEIALVLGPPETSARERSS